MDDDDELDSFTEEQFTTIERNVAKITKNPKDKRQSQTIDPFGELTDEQFSVLDQAVEDFNANHRQPRHQNVATESQLEAAMALLDELDSEPSLEHLKCLQTRFKHQAFREKQWEIIDTVMNKKRDVCAVMATGYGKSLCFQFPAVYKNGMVLVISPLISLMQAQVLTLNDLQIPACLVGSAQDDQCILLRIQKGEFNVIYSSPEYLQGQQGIQMLHSLKNRLTLIAIDGKHSFRFNFRMNRSHI